MVRVRLSVKFLLLIIGILVVFLGVFSVLVIRRESRLLARKNAEQEQLLAQTIVADLKESMLTGRPRSTLALMASLKGTYGLVRLEVLRKDGTPAFDQGGPAFAFPQIGQTFESGRFVDFDEEGEEPVHTNIFPLQNATECRQCHGRSGSVLGVILISHGLSDTLEEIQSSKRHLLALFGALILLTGSVLYLIIRKVVLLPLRALHRGAEVIGSGDLSQRIIIESGDEFEELAVSFNDMAGHVKETRDGLENTVKIRTTELHESVRLMRGILSSMSSGVVLLGRDGTVKLMNRQGALIFGRGHEDLLGRKLAEAVPETAAFLGARVGSYQEITAYTPAGLSRPVGFTTSIYAGSDDDEGGLIAVFQDLTELKALQTELMDKERFAAVGRVVAGVAHEIRNPLFSISAIGQIFERDLTDPGHRELVRSLLGETKRLNQLVEELLLYGRPMRLRLEDADLQVLWEDVIDLHRDELQVKGIKVSGNYAVRHPVAVFDPHQVRQVLLNVLRNAIEAMPGGGTLTGTMLLEDEFIVLRIGDTGTGIPTAQLEHVFDLFFTTKPKGTGLGLGICRKIMQDHGGDISLTSGEGLGTTVTVRLPYGTRAGKTAADARTGLRSK